MTPHPPQAVPPSPRGEGSGLDELFDDLHSRAEVIDDKRLADAEKIVKNSMNKDKSTLGEKVEKAKSSAIRMMVNSGHALRKIENETGDEFLYPIYNKTRSSSNIASDMIGRKQTDVLGREVGEGLEEIFSPIKEKGEEYFHDFQLYMFHRHNIARMSLFNAEKDCIDVYCFDYLL